MEKLQKNMDKIHGEMDDMWKARDKREQNRMFEEQVDYMRQEYEENERFANEKKTERDNLQKAIAKMTDKTKIKKAQKDMKWLKADIDVATTRMAELKAEYEMMVEEKEAREEEARFYEKMDKMRDAVYVLEE